VSENDYKHGNAELFRRRLTNLEAAWRNRSNWGRNVGSQAGAEYRYGLLCAMARTGEICDLLDNNPKLAARWNRMERRMVGLPV
jgi:hypothetical protein